MRQALSIGINDYGGSNNLSGCINDAKAWQSLLKDRFGYATEVMFDSDATHSAVAAAITKLADLAKSGDSVVITYSGHGTSIPDIGEKDEIDGRDEAICLYDTIMVDDEIRALTNRFSPGVNVHIISDSCHSGSVVRIPEDDDVAEVLTPRYRPLINLQPILSSRNMFGGLRDLPVKGKFWKSSSSRVLTLISGCKDNEYSYDAYFDKPMGAMSYYATNILAKANRKMTWTEFYKELRTKLPSTRYPQSPQMLADSANMPVFS